MNDRTFSSTHFLAAIYNRDYEIFTEETFSFRYRNRIDLRCADLLASNSTSTI